MNVSRSEETELVTRVANDSLAMLFTHAGLRFGEGLTCDVYWVDGRLRCQITNVIDDNFEEAINEVERMLKIIWGTNAYIDSYNTIDIDDNTIEFQVII